MTQLLSFLAGMALVALVAYLLFRRVRHQSSDAQSQVAQSAAEALELRMQLTRVETNLQNAENQMADLQQEKQQLLSAKETLQAAQSQLQSELQSTQTLLDATRKQAATDAATRTEQFQTQLKLAREEMRAQFEKEMIERTESLKKVNTEQMEQVVGPLQKELEGLRQLVTTSKEAQDKNLTSLEAGIKAVFEHDKERDKTTQNLANALKNRGKVQGDWGEQVLENILRDSGLREGEEYFTQESVKDKDGNNLRPDLIVRAADGSRIVLDSKVSLTAYTDYVGAETEAERNDAIRANHDSIWKHVEELAEKKYPTLVEKSVPQVLMFVPNEGAYILAMNKDPQLGTKAYRKGVLIVNPTNLMVVLKLILLTWQNTRQEKTNRSILEAAAGIYEKYATFTEEYLKLDTQLTTLRTTYNRGLGQLRDGKSNLSSRIEKLLKYGVTPSKRLSESAMSVLPDTDENEAQSEE